MIDNIEILKALPVLQKMWRTPTLAEYFKETVASLKTTKTFPEKQLFVDTITQEIKRLYGDETAREIATQINQFPVIETGTHLAFLRDYDSPLKDDLRSRLNQNVIISSALMRHMGYKYHVGVYGSNVSLNHPCGGGFYQLGNELFPVTALRHLRQVCLYDAPGVDKDYFNETVRLMAKIKLMDECLTEETIQKISPAHQDILIKSRKIINGLLEPLCNDKNNYGAVERQYRSLNTNNQELIKKAMLILSPETYKKYGYTFSDIDKQYQELAEVFNRPHLKLPDQVALIQAKTINKILNETGIQHISIDAMEVARQFLVTALENEKTLWYKIFNDPDKFKNLHQAFVGIRSSWKENESPFDYVKQDKGFFKCLSLPLQAIEHTPQQLISLLKNKEILPSNALIILILQSSNMMAHGGFFQTTYADKVKKRFVTFLQNIGETERAEQVQKLPVDMALLSLAVIKESNGNPMKLSEMARMSTAKRKELMDMIPGYPSCQAVVNGLPVLNRYLVSTAPGYVETESAHAPEPQLTCRLEKTINMFANKFKKERAG